MNHIPKKTEEIEPFTIPHLGGCTLTHKVTVNNGHPCTVYYIGTRDFYGVEEECQVTQEKVNQYV